MRMVTCAKARLPQNSCGPSRARISAISLSSRAAITAVSGWCRARRPVMQGRRRGRAGDRARNPRQRHLQPGQPHQARSAPTSTLPPRNGFEHKPAHPSGSSMRPPAVIIHGLDHARMALAPGLPVTLLSAPGAGVYAGAGWWRALMLALCPADPDILDCGSAAGAGAGGAARPGRKR